MNESTRKHAQAHAHTSKIVRVHRHIRREAVEKRKRLLFHVKGSVGAASSSQLYAVRMTALAKSGSLEGVSSPCNSSSAHWRETNASAW